MGRSRTVVGVSRIPRVSLAAACSVAVVYSVAFVVASSVAPTGVAAQTTTGDGFLFQRPPGFLELRGGLARPNASSDLFDQVTRDLTLGRGALSGLSGGMTVSAMVRPRLALDFGGSISSRTRESEYRDFVDNNDQPINQSTRFTRLPLTVGARVFLTEPGRALGRLAWVPSRFAPYVAAGGGVAYYSFTQDGSFIDFDTNDVFDSEIGSRGWTPTGYGGAGLVYSLGARYGLVTEARYDLARARLGSDFEGFDRIDLSGAQLTVGLHVRF